MHETSRRAEFEAICIPLMRLLYGVAVRLTRRPDDARDLVQETFLRAYRTFAGFRSGTSAKAWMFTILHSVFLNRVRKQRRAPESVPLEDVDERFLAAAASFEPSRAASAIGPDDIEAALRELPEPFRVAVLLVDVEGLSYEEASLALACPVGTLRSRLARGRRALFVRLRPKGPSGPRGTRGEEVDGAD